MNIMYKKISTKGQLTIPKKFREKLNIQDGDEVTLVLTEDGIIVRPKISNISILRGLLKDNIDLDKAKSFIESERKKWRI